VAGAKKKAQKKAAEEAVVYEELQLEFQTVRL